MRIRKADGVVRYDTAIRNFMEKEFPAVFVLRENLFQIIGTSGPISGTSFGIFENEPETVGFLEKFLLLNKCVGYTQAEMERSIEIYDWLQSYLIDLAVDAVGNKIIYEVGEKLAICFSYVYQIMQSFPRTNDIYHFWKIAENFYKVLCDISVFSDSYHQFIVMRRLGKIGDYSRFFDEKFMERVIRGHEFHLFVEHEKEIFIAMEAQELESMDRQLARIPDTAVERAWVNNLLLNKHINDPFGLPDYAKMKKTYDLIVKGGGVPTYFEHECPTEERAKETGLFSAIVAALKENDRAQYRKLDSRKSLYNLDWKSLCEELGVNTLDRREEAEEIYLEGCKRKKEDLEKCIEEEAEIEDITSYYNVISHYFATAFPDPSVDVYRAKDSKAFFGWLYPGSADDLESSKKYWNRRSASEQVGSILSFKHRIGRKENAALVKEWLDDHQEEYSILDSDRYCWIYFNEFENYFNDMIETEPETVYLALKNNKLWVKIWKQITPNYDLYHEDGYMRFALGQSLIYLVFVIKRAVEKGELPIAKRCSIQYIKDICKYGYFDLGQRLFAWVECQKVLRETGEKTVDRYEPIHQLEKEYERMKDDPERKRKYYIKTLDLRLKESICAFLFGDYGNIPDLEKTIRALVVEAKEETLRSHWNCIEESHIKSISLQVALMDLIHRYVSGIADAGAFARKAEEMLPHLRERYCDSEFYAGILISNSEGIDHAEAFLFSMFMCLCKTIFSHKEYARLFSGFDKIIAGFEFSFAKEGFSLHFSYDRSDWFFMI